MVEVTQAEVTLLPCPFCGSDEVSHGWQSPGIDGSMSTGTAECHNCGAFVFAETEAKAIAAWNARESATAPLEAQIAELVEALGGILDRGYVSQCIEEERADYLKARATLAKIEAMKEQQ